MVHSGLDFIFNQFVFYISIYFLYVMQILIYILVMIAWQKVSMVKKKMAFFHFEYCFVFGPQEIALRAAEPHFTSVTLIPLARDC